MIKLVMKFHPQKLWNCLLFQVTLHPGDGEPQKLDKVISKIIIDKRDNLDLNNFDMACDHDVFEGKNIIDLCSLNSIYTNCPSTRAKQ